MHPQWMTIMCRLVAVVLLQARVSCRELFPGFLPQGSSTMGRLEVGKGQAKMNMKQGQYSAAALCYCGTVRSLIVSQLHCITVDSCTAKALLCLRNTALLFVCLVVNMKMCMTIVCL